MDKKLNTDLTENTDLTFSLIFFLKPVFFGFICGFSWICECLGTPFSLLTSVPLVLKPILTFSKGRNKLLYFVKDFFSQSLQPPLVLPRRGDAGYSGSVKDWLMQVTLVLSKTG